MAINPESSFAGKIKPSSAAYPFGEAQDVTTPGDGTGTPWKALLLNDVFGFQQALLSEAALVPSGSPDSVTVSQYLEAVNFTKGKVVATYTVLTAFDISKLVNGTKVFVTDVLRGGEFRWDTSDLTTEVTGDPEQGIFVAPDSDATGASGAYRRILHDISTRTRWFGVTADGSTDDAAGINAAIAFARSNGRQQVEFDKGNHKYSSDLTFKDNITYIGAGRSSTELQSDSGAKIITEAASDFVTVRGLTFSGTTPDLNFSDVTNWNFIDCFFFGGTIRVSDFKYVNFVACDFGGGAGLFGSHSTINSISEAMKVTGCNFLTAAFADFSQCVDTVIAYCSFVGTADRQLRARRGSHNVNFYMPIFISNCVFDAADRHGIRLEGMTFKLENIFCSGGRVLNTSGISAVDCKESSIVNVQSRFCGDAGLELFDCDDVLNSNSHFWDNQTRGALVTSSCIDVSFDHCTFGHNPTWFGGSFVQPIGIEDPALSSTRLTIIHCRFKGMAASRSVPAGTYQAFNYDDAVALNSDFAELRPIVDNAHNLGTASRRWKEVFSAIGAINTSDETEKSPLIDIDAAELAVGKELKLSIKKFQWLDAIEKKGDSARWHFGVGAQTVKAIFEKHGLNGFDYGCLCYDEWEEGGETIGRYGVRPDQIMYLIMAAI